MLLPYKIKIANSISNILRRKIDLSHEGIASAVRLHPFFKKDIWFVVSQEPELNDPGYSELSALKNAIEYEDVQMQYLFRKPFISVRVNYNQFAQDILTADLSNLFSYRKSSKILIEFSSPNIAKSFHWGHMRSTLVGNFVSKINNYVGNEVTTMNYLGDWGMQIGLLKAGLEICKFSQDEIAENVLKKLQEAYVAANLELEQDAKVEERAKELFCQLEFADEHSNEMEEWRTFRQLTMRELQRIYKLLDIHFDQYSFESEYSAKKIQPLIEELKAKKIIVPEYDKSLVTWIDDQLVPFLKMDGTTLYLTRDVAAALDRYKKFRFDKLYYIVDTMQRGHFVALVRILEKLGAECASKIEYIPFGRVKGMSTRKGEAVWLDDILIEARKKMEQKQIESITRKAPLEGETIDILAKSALIISDLKKNRMRHYEFDWNVALQSEGYCGIKLQYCHCRLHSLAENCGATVADHCEPKVLQELEAVALVHAIARFEDAVIDSLERFEACFLVSYLFDLCDAVNKALKVLRVKGEESYVGSQRLLLFMKAKEVLNVGMKLLGMNPLDQM